MAAEKRNTRTEIAEAIDEQSSRLAGVADILRLVMEKHGSIDALATAQEVLEDANSRISELAVSLR